MTPSPLRSPPWTVVQPSLPCWRLWWNSNPGAGVRFGSKWINLDRDRFVLVAPETPFTVRLERTVKRHLFIHFGLNAPRWRLTGRVIEIAADTLTRTLATELVSRLPLDPRITVAEPFLGVSLVSAVLARLEPTEWAASAADARVQRVVSEIARNVSLPWPCEAMARLATMSVGGFVRLFKRDMGLAPQRYLVRQRLALARNLLLQSDLTIEAITDRCGFCDRSYFSTVFRREVGMPPATFREGANHLA